jgi:hypothetical protein
MRRHALLAVLLLVPSLATAGEIYGKITEGTASVGEKATLSVKCGGTAYPAQKTDKSGSYHLVVKESGKCSLTVAYSGQSASLEVVSYDDPVQLDLAVESKDGKLSVRRK